jgi:Raf kinase inhibitor-like YbhB/YbcL family protein
MAPDTTNWHCDDEKSQNEKRKIMELKSSVFEAGSIIPKKYTCEGQDISPPLSWNTVPEKTQSLALICDDPDAPMGVWVHWVVFNLPADTREMAENVPPQKTLANGAKQGTNDFRKIGYGGPCPLSGEHRYFFKLYALDTKLASEAGIKKAALLKIMEGHILDESKLMGKYRR